MIFFLIMQQAICNLLETPESHHPLPFNVPYLVDSFALDIGKTTIQIDGVENYSLDPIRKHRFW